MITTPDGLGHFAVIRNGCDMTNVVQLENHRNRRRSTMTETRPQFEDTVPTDFGGLNERRNYTPEGMRIGMLLLIASAAVMTLAVIVIAATLNT